MTDSPSEGRAGKGNQKGTTTILGKELPPLRSAGVQPEAVAMECGAAIGKGEMEKFVQSFQQSAKRWEVIVYPALFAFSVLAAYGFFLIYSLTSDMTMMARSMDPKMGEHMDIMSKSIVQLSEQVHIMSNQVQIMSSTMIDISEKLNTLPPMLNHIGNMDSSMLTMDSSMQDMRGSMKSMTGSMIKMEIGFLAFHPRRFPLRGLFQ